MSKHLNNDDMQEQMHVNDCDAMIDSSCMHLIKHIQPSKNIGASNRAQGQNTILAQNKRTNLLKKFFFFCFCRIYYSFLKTNREW